MPSVASFRYTWIKAKLRICKMQKKMKVKCKVLIGKTGALFLIRRKRSFRRAGGLYPGYGKLADLITNIRYFGMNANIYNTFEKPYYTFTPKWWHYIYQIPRKW